MVIKVYISGSSGNKEVKKRQQRVLLILDSKNVKYEVIDIAEPGAEEAKDFMQNNSTSLGATIGDPTPRHALPPQIFNDDDYCGDYDMFDMANEVDEMEVFLKLEPNSLNEKISTFETKLKNGDLSIDEKIDKVLGSKTDNDEIEQNEQNQVQEDDKKEESVRQEDNRKEGSVEKKVDDKEKSEEREVSKEGSAEKEVDTKEGSEEREGNKEKSEEREVSKEGSAEKEVDAKEGSEEKQIGKGDVEVDKEDKSEKNENEDSDAEGDHASENDEEEDKKDDEKVELDKEASPEKSE